MCDVNKSSMTSSIRSRSKYTFWDEIRLSQIKYKYIVFLDFNSNTNTLPFLFRYDSNTLPFLKFDSDMIRIHGLCFHYSSSVSQWVPDINWLRSLDRMFFTPVVWSTVGRQH